MRGKLKSVILLGCFVAAAPLAFAQGEKDIQLDTCRVFTSMATALKVPENVYVLKLSKNKLKELPKEVGQLKNLRVLVLSKNALTTLPKEVALLTYLQIVDLSKNKIEIFPESLTACKALKKLILNQNPITALPYDIKNLTELEYLDLWGTEMSIFPSSMIELKNLKEVDLRSVTYNKREKEYIESILPGVKIHFSSTCNCGG